MQNGKQISSVQNALVKKILVLQEKSRERRKTGLFVLEGLREVGLALKGGYIIRTVLFQDAIISSDAIGTLFKEAQGHPKEQDAKGSEIPVGPENPVVPEIIAISDAVYQKLAYRGTTEGVIALAESKGHGLEDIHLKSPDPLILVAEAPEKPGNIGALLRTADAAGLDAVIIANPKTDLYNPNVIRSSVGCLFTNQVATGSTSEIIAYLKERKIRCYCAALTASQAYTEIDFRQASAIVVGTEATGLTSEWLKSSDQNILIPMQGEIDSLNVSVSAAILIFEAKRQRGVQSQ